MLMHSAQNSDVHTKTARHKQQVRGKTKLTWHLGKVDVQVDRAMGRYSSQTDKKKRSASEGPRRAFQRRLIVINYSIT